MLIEIRRAGFVNKGAELMLVAIVSQLRNRYQNVDICMAPTFGGSLDTFEKMRDMHIYPRAWLWKFGFNWLHFVKYLPFRLRRYHGFVLDKDIDIVIDAAGFAYTQQWGATNSVEFACAARVVEKYGSKLIMMPQALGPFNNPLMRWSVKSWARVASTVFVRESLSLAHLKPFLHDQSKLKICPDFTNLVEGKCPERHKDLSNKVAFIPNYRMIDKNSSKNSKQLYIEFFCRCSRIVDGFGYKPFVLVHEGQDSNLATEVAIACGGLSVVKVDDPVEIKGIIGACYATIGSRFHGLASALSQGVPSLGTGWSHKYEQLFNDYGFEEGLISVTDNDETLEVKIAMLLELLSHSKLSGLLQSKSDKLKKQSKEMWDEVFDEIEKNNK